MLKWLRNQISEKTIDEIFRLWKTSRQKALNVYIVYSKRTKVFAHHESQVYNFCHLMIKC